ncbi:hypothetical protein CYXG_00138 [Synechococcus phage S-SSM4]|uniref:DUF7441 domain-containing protein n=1 Tax=Synechococcus phage S-SSM4 TaxID=536466 RepID=M1UG32_9CAUD|nr:hypothetical protein CYXG_00138 [Synechococcus phage S-SSM4]AGG54202.1 hypothetical protein CYXG_00138 [Synechococcus phage S-SSM4]AGG54439.1 hypothetical protein CYWG_00155 [Cyanophage S-SSM6b]
MTQRFTCTSTEPYDRHDYQIVLKNGKKIKFTDWGTTMDYWLQWRTNVDVINVLDKKEKKGFS